MPERKVEVDNTKNSSASGELVPEETREQKKARLAQVFDRGRVGDRLHVDLPPHLEGEWVPTRDGGLSVMRKQALGYHIDTQYAKQHSALHDKGDEGSHVGDVVFMVTTKENKQLLDEIRAERFRELHQSKGGRQKEDRDYVGRVDEEVKPLAESRTHKAGVSDITDALKAVISQSQGN